VNGQQLFESLSHARFDSRVNHRARRIAACVALAKSFDAPSIYFGTRPNWRCSLSGTQSSRALFYVHPFISDSAGTDETERWLAHGESYRGFDVGFAQGHPNPLEQGFAADTIAFGTKHAEFIAAEAGNDVE